MLHEDSQIKHASFCSGFDAFALAATALGWDHVFYSEINEFCLQMLKYYYPNAKKYGNIKDESFKDWRGKLDVLSAGFPCQPFSVAGSRTGESHNSYLWPDTLRVVDESRPTWFIGENVDGITSMVFPGEAVEVGTETDLFGAGYTVYEKRERYVLDRICDDLEAIGYSVQPVIIPACGVGAPHKRYRCFFLAYSESGRSLRITRGYEEESGEERLQKRDEIRKPVESDHLRGSASDSDSFERCEGRGNQNRSAETKRHFGLCDSRGDWRTWENFPTQSPIRCRDDGFSSGLHGITFSKWRSESITGYGNAIVPQVVYQIYSMIDKVHKGDY